MREVVEMTERKGERRNTARKGEKEKKNIVKERQRGR